VKAVKNEQSSQVSKLNDEIRLLKEKLMNQSSGAGAQDGQDASALDEKNRHRLRDLEEAMRSTWEAKSKLSEEYERDRQALLIEQQNAARQFEAARQRNWALLEQKEDLEITLGHVRTLLADRLAHTPVAGLVGQWAEGLREVAQLERRLAEQDTVVQVYRSSLEKDSRALVQVRSCVSVFMERYKSFVYFFSNTTTCRRARVGR
jgi:chromosome segregation ATPase